MSWHWTHMGQKRAHRQSSQPEHTVAGMLSRTRTFMRTMHVSNHMATTKSEPNVLARMKAPEE